MGRAPCCDKANVKRGPWSPEEDIALKNYVEKHGAVGNWIALPQKAGLKRCGKSCRLRWLNYLRPGIKHGGFTEEEDKVIFSLYKSLGSRWSVIASHLPGRTDNDVKNYWNTKLKKKLLTSQANPSSGSNTKNDHIHHSASHSPLTGVVPTVKSENYDYGSFSMSADHSSSCSLTSMDAGPGFNSHSSQYRPVSEPSSFPVPALAEPPNYGGGANGYMVSTPQDISAASSSLATHNSNSYVSWSNNGDGGSIDAFLMDLALGSMDFLGGGYGLFDKLGDDGSTPAGMANPWPDAASKPQELYQRVTYS